MHVLLVGTGGVGTCVAKLAAQRDPLKGMKNSDSSRRHRLVLVDQT